MLAAAHPHAEPGWPHIPERTRPALGSAAQGEATACPDLSIWSRVRRIPSWPGPAWLPLFQGKKEGEPAGPGPRAGPSPQGQGQGDRSPQQGRTAEPRRLQKRVKTGRPGGGVGLGEPEGASVGDSRAELGAQMDQAHQPQRQRPDPNRVDRGRQGCRLGARHSGLTQATCRERGSAPPGMGPTQGTGGGGLGEPAKGHSPSIRSLHPLPPGRQGPRPGQRLKQGAWPCVTCEAG